MWWANVAAHSNRALWWRIIYTGVITGYCNLPLHNHSHHKARMILRSEKSRAGYKNHTYSTIQHKFECLQIQPQCVKGTEHFLSQWYELKHKEFQLAIAKSKLMLPVHSLIGRRGAHPGKLYCIKTYQLLGAPWGLQSSSDRRNQFRPSLLMPWHLLYQMTLPSLNIYCKQILSQTMTPLSPPVTHKLVHWEWDKTWYLV